MQTEINETLLTPLYRFNREHLRPGARFMESQGTISPTTENKLTELGVVDLLQEGIWDNPVLSAETLFSMIETLAHGDAASAFYLLRTVPRRLFEHTSGCASECDVFVPYEGCPFVPLEKNLRTVSVIACKDNAIFVETKSISSVRNVEYGGLRGISFLADYQINGDGQKLNMSADSYRAYLATLSILYQSIYLGLLRATIEYAMEYCRQRTAFGMPIVRFQAISQKLANMALAYEASKTYVGDISFHHESNKMTSMAMMGADLLCSNGPTISLEAVQALGGHGYIEDHPVEKWMRDGQVIAMFLRDLNRHLRGQS